MLNHIIRARQRRKRIQESIIAFLISRRKLLVRVCLISLLFIMGSLNDENHTIFQMHRSCRRYTRNSGWWENVWSNYPDKRFKKTFRVSRQTFSFILCQIRGDIEKDSLTEASISQECRLGICLYRLARGDYLYTISELTGYGVSTVYVK